MSSPRLDLTTPLPGEPVDDAPTMALPPADRAARQPAGAARAVSRPGVGPGTVLRQRYVLERELGRGGMGTVYRAVDLNRQGLEPQQRCVAVKVLREEFARRPDALQALRREAHQAQSLSHPGIVNVFDFDHDGGVHFITMELLEGELLSELIERIRPGKLRRSEAIDILRDLGNAVAYAHSRGVLHMDLKPGNVMITTQGEVRVLDLGLARPRMTEPWISDQPPPFHAATPTYASCEQLDGAAQDVRDDVFSFACVAYELLSGEHPFGRSSARDARAQGYRLRRIRGLSRRQWRTLRAGLAWRRDDRPRSLAELLHGLGLDTGPQPVPIRRRSGRPAAGRRTSPWWAAIAVLGVVAAGLYVAWNRLTAPEGGGRGAPSADAEAVRPSPREARPQPASEAVEAPASDAASAERAPAQMLVTEADIAPPDVAAALASTPEPTPRIALAGPGRLTFEESPVTVSESAGVVPLRVVRSGGAEGAVSFSWRTIDDSATADRDYAGLGTVRETIGHGVTSRILLVPIVSDAIAESTELFDVVIEEPTAGATLGPVNQVTIIIVDDD